MHSHQRKAYDNREPTQGEKRIYSVHLTHQTGSAGHPHLPSLADSTAWFDLGPSVFALYLALPTAIAPSFVVYSFSTP